MGDSYVWATPKLATPKLATSKLATQSVSRKLSKNSNMIERLWFEILDNISMVWTNMPANECECRGPGHRFFLTLFFELINLISRPGHSS